MVVGVEPDDEELPWGRGIGLALKEGRKAAGSLIRFLLATTGVLYMRRVVGESKREGVARFLVGRNTC